MQFFEIKIPVRNSNKTELNALEHFKKNKYLVIQNAANSSIVVIINKNDYKTKIKDILYNSTKFKKLEIDENKKINFLINSKK